MNLPNNAILLTGGSTGIGFTLAAALLARGNRVLDCGRRETRLAKARQKLPALETLTAPIHLAQLSDSASCPATERRHREHQSGLASPRARPCRSPAPRKQPYTRSRCRCVTSFVTAPSGCTRRCRRWWRASCTITSYCLPTRDFVAGMLAGLE